MKNVFHQKSTKSITNQEIDMDNEKLIELAKEIDILFKNLNTLKQNILMIFVNKNQLEKKIQSTNKLEKQYQQLQTTYKKLNEDIDNKLNPMQTLISEQYAACKDAIANEKANTNNKNEIDFLNVLDENLYNQIVDFQMITGLSIIQS